jgi:carbonic anhydrase
VAVGRPQSEHARREAHRAARDVTGRTGTPKGEGKGHESHRLRDEANTKEQIQKARSHPWISPEVPVRGFVYDVSTGRLSEVFADRETVTG